MENDIEKVIETNLEELVKSKSERQKVQNLEFEKYSSYVGKNKLCEGSEIVFLWKKIAEELNSGRYIKDIESDTKDKIFKHYEYLILESINKYGENIYLTPLELINKMKENFWSIIASFGYFILNKATTNDKLMLEEKFLEKANISIKIMLSELVHRERQKFLGYDGRSYFIYRNEDGSIDRISIGINDEHRRGSGIFVGTDEEKQKFADEYEKKWSALAKFEKTFYKK